MYCSASVCNLTRGLYFLLLVHRIRFNPRLQPVVHDTPVWCRAGLLRGLPRSNEALWPPAAKKKKKKSSPGASLLTLERANRFCKAMGQGRRSLPKRLRSTS